ANVAPVAPGQPAEDREAGAAVPAGAGAVRLPEPLEDVREEIRADALAGVADGEPGAVVDALERDADPPTARRELHRVRDQVPDDLLQALRVSLPRDRERRARGLERHSR